MLRHNAKCHRCLCIAWCCNPLSNGYFSSKQHMSTDITFTKVKAARNVINYDMTFLIFFFPSSGWAPNHTSYGVFKFGVFFVQTYLLFITVAFSLYWRVLLIKMCLFVFYFLLLIAAPLTGLVIRINTPAPPSCNVNHLLAKKKKRKQQYKDLMCSCSQRGRNPVGKHHIIISEWQQHSNNPETYHLINANPNGAGI